MSAARRHRYCTSKVLFFLIHVRPLFRHSHHSCVFCFRFFCYLIRNRGRMSETIGLKCLACSSLLHVPSKRCRCRDGERSHHLVAPQRHGEPYRCGARRDSQFLADLPELHASQVWPVTGGRFQSTRKYCCFFLLTLPVVKLVFLLLAEVVTMRYETLL